MSLEVPRSSGVLPSQWLRKARDHGYIRSETYAFDDSQIQPASFDLRLGDWAYRLRCSFLAGSAPVLRRLPAFAMEKIDLRDGAILERNRPYLIPLSETLNLPPGLMGRANPKSSTGRLDIFTRLITDRSHLFDEIAPEYRGGLYLELVSRSFTVKVRQGMSLNQLRLIVPGGEISDEELRVAHSMQPILFSGNRTYTRRGLPVSDGLFLSLALAHADGHQAVGWRARKNSMLLDLTRVGYHDPFDYWEPVYPERGGGIILEPEEFYLLLSKERVRVPPDFAAEMTAYDPTSGELRTHYAGFFDPGFGHSGETPAGSHAALEVRAHDVPFMVDDGQRICRLSFEKLVDTPGLLYGSTNSHYQFQTGTLSKHFQNPETVRPNAGPPPAPMQEPEPESPTLF